MDDEQFDLQIQSSEWTANEATELLEKYKACKTEHARKKLLPKMEYLLKRMYFERNQLLKITGNQYGQKE